MSLISDVNTDQQNQGCNPQSNTTARMQRAIENFWHRDPELAFVGDNIESTRAAGSHNANSLDRLLPWIFLQPYAEYLADHREIEIVNGTPSTCRFAALSLSSAYCAAKVMVRKSL